MAVYVPNVAGFNYEFKSPAGMVGQNMRKRGERLVGLARRDVGRKTNFLALSIHSTLGRTASGEVMATVGSSARVALMHHTGTRPHIILPRRAGALRFNSGGRIVYARRVMHPGTKPNPYLTRNLPLVVLT